MQSKCFIQGMNSHYDYCSNWLYPDYAIQNKLTPFISMQNHYSLAYKEEEREMFPTLKVSTDLKCPDRKHAVADLVS